MRLRPGDVVQLSQELFDVVQRWANSQRDPSDPAARQVIVHVLAIPLAEEVQ
jgi:hypothetical protein